MSTKRFVIRCRFAVILALIASLLSQPAAQTPRQPEQRDRTDGPGHAKIKRVHEFLANARINGQSEVTLLMASQPGANAKVAQQIRVLGGTVRFREDEVDYLRTRISTDRVEDAMTIPEIQLVEVGSDQGTLNSVTNEPAGNQTAVDGSQEQTQKPVAIPPPDRSLQPVNPYIPVGDIGAPQFIAAHPTFDGRGTGIAVVETVPDFLTPELQQAMTRDGKPVRKIIDVLFPWDPREDAERHPFVVAMQDKVRAQNGQFTYQGQTYIAPAGLSDAELRFGFLDESKNGKRVADFNLDGNPPGSNPRFGIIWDERTNEVWVDTNQNFSFADEKALTDYGVRFDLGMLGKDNPETPKRESQAFIVHPDRVTKSVIVYPANDFHPTSVSSAAAGSGFFGGKANGAAPGAQLVFAVAPGSYSLIEGMIMAAQDARVDVITTERLLLYRLRDGNNVLQTILDRVVDRYKKPIFWSAGNAPPGVNGVSDAGSKVMKVGSYISKETFYYVLGVTAARTEYVHPVVTAHGPRSDGGFKPDIVVPAAGIFASSPVWAGRFPYSGNGIYTLPPGYMATVGTSFASPIAAGATALLISAAKQSGVPYDAERLCWALKASARYLSDYGAYQQGAGLINVGAAWEALKHAPTPVTITSRAPVNTILGGQLKEPYHGPGIYEREGWVAGQSRQRTITFTRSSGPVQPVSYDLRWQGNDGTFSSQPTIRLPLNVPMSVPITVAPKTAGVHSALLNLDEPGGARSIYQVMNTVVAAEQFTEAEKYTITWEGTVEYPGKRSYFVKVPTGTAALRIGITTAKGNLRPRFINPAGTEGLFFDYFTKAWTAAQENPEPGVWEIILENAKDSYGQVGSAGKAVRHASADEGASFTLTTEVLGVDVKPTTERMVLDLAASHEQEVSFTNRLAAFAGGIVETPLGSAYADRPRLTAGGPPKIYQVEVPDGTKMLTARLSGATDRAADLDLYLLEPSDKKHFVRAGGISNGTEETATVFDPKPGMWKVVIAPVSIPSGETRVDYLDVFTHPAFGVLTSAQTAQQYRSGARWTGKVSVRVAAVPAGKRFLVGLVEVAREKADNVEVRFKKEEKETVQRRVVLGTAIVRLKNPAQ